VKFSNESYKIQAKGDAEGTVSELR